MQSQPDSRPAVQRLTWMDLVRDATPPFGTQRLAVLWALALRLDKHGEGFASHKRLAADVLVTERTAERATADARRRGYLVQTRRGHRITAAVAAASSWRLTQPDTADGLALTQPDTRDALDEANPTRVTASHRANPTQTPTQPDRGVGLMAPLQGVKQRAAAEVVMHNTGCTDAEASAVVELIRTEKTIRHSARGFVETLAAAGELDGYLDRVRQADREHRREAAYRDGWRCPLCSTHNPVSATECRHPLCHEPAPVTAVFA